MRIEVYVTMLCILLLAKVDACANEPFDQIRREHRHVLPCLLQGIDNHFMFSTPVTLLRT